MATLIDDGFVEDCHDKTTTIKNFEEYPVIDLDDIDATIEDPGYILEDLDICEQTKEFTSSYRKQSLPLPAQFFDISRNIQLLKKCRPISIKVVDCDIYPWYYKRKKCQVEDKKQHDEKPRNEEGDFYNNNTNNENSSSTNEFNNLKLSLEQTFTVIKLKEEIEKQKNIQMINLNFNKDEHNLKHHEGSTQEPLLPDADYIADTSNLDKIIEPKDLLTYEAIAQTIVRNIDYSQASSGEGSVLVLDKNNKIITNTIDSYQGDVEMINIVDFGEAETNDNVGKEITTSPILPCTIKPKKTRTKSKFTSNVKKSVFEKCRDQYKGCHKLMSANKLIPHYHYRLPMTKADNGFNNTFIRMDNNEMSQYNITNDTSLHHVQQNEVINGLQPHQYIHNYHYDTDKSGPNLQHNCQRFEGNANRIDYISYVDYNPVSSINSLMFNNTTSPPVSSNVIGDDVYKNNINSTPFAHYQRPQFNYLETYQYQNNSYPESVYPSQAHINNVINKADVRGPNISKENYRVFSQNSNLGHTSPIMAVSVQHNKNINSTIKWQNPLHMSAANIQNSSHPVLSNLLDHNGNSYITNSVNNIKACTDMKHINQMSVGPSRPMKTLNKTSLDDVINVLAQKNGDALTIRSNDCNNVRGKKNIDSKKIIVPTPQFTALGTRQDNKLDDNRSNNLQPTLNDFKTYIPKNNTENNTCKISRYSPPILPIPTFTKDLEMLSKLHPHIPANENSGDCLTMEIYTKKHVNKSRKQCKDTKMTRKRKVDNTDIVCMHSRKISLHEYKQRMLENGKESHIFVDRTKDIGIKMQNKNTTVKCYVGEDVSFGMPNLDC